jgi:hypothetical protein
MTKSKIDQKKVREGRKVNKAAKQLADVLTALHEIRGDLSFLYDIFYELDEPNNFRKIQIAVPFLDAKVNFIDDMMEDYATYLPEKLRAEISERE